jgi:hypothetical protein
MRYLATFVNDCKITMAGVLPWCPGWVFLILFLTVDGLMRLVAALTVPGMLTSGGDMSLQPAAVVASRSFHFPSGICCARAVAFRA